MILPSVDPSSSPELSSSSPDSTVGNVVLTAESPCLAGEYVFIPLLSDSLPSSELLARMLTGVVE